MGLMVALSVLVITNCLLALAPTGCDAHGYLLKPLSRGLVLKRADYEIAAGNGLGLLPWRTDAKGTINDQADPCGDPHQQYASFNIASTVPAQVAATYSSGQIIEIDYKVTVHHAGWLAVNLCAIRKSPTQACFDQTPLINADTKFRRWWMPIKQDVYRTRWQLPSGFVCPPEGCTLELTWKTANSCIDRCSVAECGTAYNARGNMNFNIKGPLQYCDEANVRGEIFRDCTDIKITGGGGGGVTGSPSKPPLPVFNRPPPPVPGCADGINGGSIVDSLGKLCPTCCTAWKNQGKCDGKSTVLGGKVVSTICCATCRK